MVIELPFRPVQFGLLSLLLGLGALVSRLQTERGRRLFYEGPGPEEDGDVLLGCLWCVPLSNPAVHLAGVVGLAVLGAVF